jgi:uncharacterized protein (TIGR02270 family)
MQSQSSPTIIEPLVRRHAEDAAFYWSQHDASTDSPYLKLSGLSRFSQLLDANLVGLTVAGQDGFRLSLATLEQWKKPAEAFVAAHAALSAADADQCEAVLAQVRARPDELIRGVISALAWLQTARARAVVGEWTSAGSESIKQVIALRAVALMGAEALGALGRPLQDLLNDPDEHVRAAACRVGVFALGVEQVRSLLFRRLDDSKLAVRAEAAIALSGCQASADEDVNLAEVAMQTLSECVVAQAAVLTFATGWYRKQALRRLNRWVRNLGAARPTGQDCPQVLDTLPPELRLRFIAYHGDARYLPQVVEHMGDQTVSRYAGWVWEVITGVDLAAAGLCLPEPELDNDSVGITEVSVDAGVGLAQPDVDAINRYPTAGLMAGRRYLRGTGVAPAHALSVLDNGTQALRSIAAHHLRAEYPQAWLPIRAAVPAQMAALSRMKAFLTSSELK